MPILHSARAPNMIQIGFHRPVKLEIDLVTGMAIAQVHSHTDEQSYLDGLNVAWNWPLTVPMSLLGGAGSVIDKLERALVETDGSPFNGGAVVPDLSTSIDTLRARKVAAMREACTAAIFAGFTSDALGAVYSYPAKTLDQSNLIASVASSLYPDLPPGWSTTFWCVDGAGVWAKRPHSAAQIQQVGQAGKDAITRMLDINDALAVAIASASREVLATIGWPA